MPVPPSAVGLVTVDHEVRVDRSMLLLFAQATGSTTPEHTDVTAARAAGHPDLLAPPTFVFGLDMMRPEPFAWLGELGVDLGAVLHGGQEFEFHQPVFAGDVLRVRGVLTGIAQKKGGQLEILTRESTVTREGELVATLVQTLVVRHAEAAA